MGLLSNRAHLVRLSNVLTESKLGNWRESGESEETSVGSQAILLVTSIRSQLNESWYLLCITKPCRVNLNLENGNGKVELGLGIRRGGLGEMKGRLWECCLSKWDPLYVKNSPESDGTQEMPEWMRRGGQPGGQYGERNRIHLGNLQEFACFHSKLTCSTFHDSWFINLAVCLRTFRLL